MRRLRGLLLTAQRAERDDEKALIETDELIAAHRAAYPFQCLLVVAIHVVSLPQQSLVPE